MIFFDKGIYLFLIRRESQLIYCIIKIRFIGNFRINLLHQLLLFTVETIKIHQTDALVCSELRRE